MANGNRYLTIFRICIGVIVAALGSIAIDEVVFKKDIDTSVVKLKGNAVQQARDEAATDFETEHGYTQLNADIAIAKTMHESAEKAVIDEANGTYGTGRRGAGKITALKEKKATERKAQLDKLLAAKTKLEEEKQQAIEAAGEKRRESYSENALLIRIKALFSLVKQDGYMLITYLLFTLLLFFFEFLVVVLKLTWKETNYEKKLEMIEEIGRRRMEFLQQKNSPLTDPGNYMPRFEMARQALKKESSVYK